MCKYICMNWGNLFVHLCKAVFFMIICPPRILIVPLHDDKRLLQICLLIRLPPFN